MIINFGFNLDKSFQEIFYIIDNWINEGSGWIIESIEGFYLNISAYSTLIGSTYIKLPDQLNNSMKGLINIQNNDNKCFLWCHVRHLNLVEKNPQRITKEEKEIVSKLHYEGMNFPVSKKDCCRIEIQNKICTNVFCYGNKLSCPVYLSNQKFNNNIDLLLISKELKSHYVYIKDFDRFMFSETKNKSKKYFCKNCFQCFSSEEILIDHREDCESGYISFKNYFKQTLVLFKIYADFECIFQKVYCDIEHNSTSLYTKNIKIIFLVVLLIKLCVLIIDLVKKLICTEEKMLLINLFKQFLMSITIVGEL